jgi:hypothetical protein
MRLLFLGLLVACGGAPRPAEQLPQPEPPPTVSQPEKLASVEQCDRLLEHMIELELATTNQTLDLATKQEHIDRQRDAFQSVCNNTPAARIECALRTVDLDGLTKCDNAP